MPKTIQLGEYSKSSGHGGASHDSAIPTATSTCAISTGTMGSGTGTTTGLTTTGMSTTRRHLSQIFSFLRSDFCWRGVLFTTSLLEGF